MKNLFYLLLLNCCFVFQSNAQLQIKRYLTEIFDSVQVTSDITYSNNIDVLSVILDQPFHSKDLKMDVYEPIGDDLTERPVVLVFHGGNFLPPEFNGLITGSKTDSSCVELCTQLAKRGFTAAAIEYRTGWNPFAAISQELTIGFTEAVYRGVQDGRTAIRFLRKNYEEEGNTFHIDPEKIIVWGNESGGVVALNMLALSDINEIINTTHGPGKLIYDSVGDGIPDTPIIIEDKHGDIEGKQTTILTEDYLMFEAGDTMNIGNHPNYSSDFNLCVNVSGFVLDIGWLDDNTIPSISFHSPFDLHYPYGDNLLVQHPGTPILQVQGSQLIGARQHELGNDQTWIEEETFIYDYSIPYTDKAIENSAIIGDPYYQSIFPSLQDQNSNLYHEGIIIDWWDPFGLSSNGTPWNELNHPNIVGTFHDYGLFINENMSAEKARLNIDTLLGYFGPRACATLDLECVIILDVFSTTEVASQYPVKLAPNPTKDVIEIDAQGAMIRGMTLYDVNGQLKKEYSNVNRTSANLSLNGFPIGVYFMKIKFDEGIVSKKIVLR